MNKIAILTLNGYFNYGNRLQNFALQEVLKSLSFDVETLIVRYDREEHNRIKSTRFERIRILKNKTLSELLSKSINKVYNIMNKKEIVKSKRLRTKVFLEFTKNHIVETDDSISNDYLSKNILDEYDFFVVGSDQVWNPFYPEVSEIYFLTFAPRKKRIAYAPSFGVSVVPEDIKEKYKEWIKDIEYLSVREKDGAKIIKDLTEREAPVLVDPTILLTKEKWLSISKKASNKPKEKYLLTYFLGGIPDNYKKQIRKIVKENNLKVINIGDIKEKETYRTGPSEFIDYINSCTVFCTDSFHGAVFSILLEKPFIVFERQGLKSTMFSRINTLLDKFDLDNRKAENICWEEGVFNIDYSRIPQILEEERNKSFMFLKEALKIKK
jgi:hypothetical protein